MTKTFREKLFELLSYPDEHPVPEGWVGEAGWFVPTQELLDQIQKLCLEEALEAVGEDEKEGKHNKSGVNCRACYENTMNAAKQEIREALKERMG